MKNYLDSCNALLKKADDKSALTSELQNLYDLTIWSDDDEFIDMIKENTEYFSKIRERTRQEYVRYLYEYAKKVAFSGDEEAIIEMFQNSSGKKVASTGKSELTQKDRTEAQAKYVEVQLPPEEWPIKILDLGNDINEFYMGGLFNVIENKYSRKDHRDLEPMATKAEKQKWLEQNSSREDADQQKQKERYDDVIRNFLRGKCDISRTLFASNALFFDFKTNGTINVLGLNDTLSRCGWNEIDYTGKNHFDRMIVDILGSLRMQKSSHRTQICRRLRRLQ